MSIHAICIEQVQSVDTDYCNNTMQRFISWRGLPSLIVSDYSTSYKGAVKELQTEVSTLEHVRIGDRFSEQKIYQQGCK